MLRHRGLGQWQVVDNFTADAGFPVNDQADNPHPSRMCQRPRKPGEFVRPFQLWYGQMFLPTAARGPAG